MNPMRRGLVMPQDASNLALREFNGKRGEVHVRDAAPLREGSRGVTVDSSAGTMLESLHPDDKPHVRETFCASLIGVQKVKLALTVGQSAEHLVCASNDILGFSTVEAGRMTLEHTSSGLGDRHPDIAAVRVVVLSPSDDHPPSRGNESSGHRRLAAQGGEAGNPSSLHSAIQTSGLGDASPGVVPTPEAGSCVDILLVDDNPVNQLVARKMLVASGYRVNAAKDVHERLDALGQGAFECILMDCLMPWMEGYTAMRQWRLREANSERPRQRIVALTDDGVEGDRGPCIDASMDDGLPKPFERAHLHALVAASLVRHEDAEGMTAQGMVTAKPTGMPLLTNTLNGSRHRNHHAEL